MKHDPDLTKDVMHLLLALILMISMVLAAIHFVARISEVPRTPAANRSAGWMLCLLSTS